MRPDWSHLGWLDIESRDGAVRDAEIRIFNRSPESDDASDTYVLDVFGLSVLIRLRTGDSDVPDTGPEPFIQH